MITDRSQLADLLRGILTRPTGGIVGLVDDLLMVGHEHALQFEWEDGRCRVRSSADAGGPWIDVPLRKSVFRAILARVAGLCNERAPHAVSPYGGKCELPSAENPAAVRVAFVNTPDEQKLELTPLECRPVDAAVGGPLSEAYRKLALRYFPEANVSPPAQSQPT